MTNPAVRPWQTRMPMLVLMIQFCLGSPSGALEAGHNIQIIDAAHADILPCIGCIQYGYEGPCVQKDDVNGIRQKTTLLAVAWNSDTWTFEALESHYDTLVRYLNLKDQGRVLVY